ncbi:hypothetical protein RF11_10637 [Thelohanellus kitauei]|uniref:Tc3 transposase DNA binding domain-containing protein n=1 Tax=Thelohanellus kitauei TaxID=669202 RepID=A0A0C2JIE0_THEKT|nr:hypothetical protein RF11_10637 [Thelohanellus kitauei]
MGNKKSLNDIEKGQILAYDTGMNEKQISPKIKRSPKVVNTFLDDKENYGTKMINCGRNPSFKSTQIAEIERLAADQAITSNEIKSRLGLNISKWTITNHLNKRGMKYSKAKNIKKKDYNGQKNYFSNRLEQSLFYR